MEVTELKGVGSSDRNEGSTVPSGKRRAMTMPFCWLPATVRLNAPPTAMRPSGWTAKLLIAPEAVGLKLSAVGCWPCRPRANKAMDAANDPIDVRNIRPARRGITVGLDGGLDGEGLVEFTDLSLCAVWNKAGDGPSPSALLGSGVHKESSGQLVLSSALFYLIGEPKAYTAFFWSGLNPATMPSWTMASSAEAGTPAIR